MATEIERKFIISGSGWRDIAAAGNTIRQGYLVDVGPDNIRASVRVRVEGDKANLNIKSATLDMTRSEYEYPIPMEDALEMLEHLCIWPLIEKTRYEVEHAGHLWEIDVFEGDNEGLVVAEIELQSVDEPFEKPSWAGEEVTDDPRYYNVCLTSNPYKEWKDDA
jgi:adenylate cyclase